MASLRHDAVLGIAPARHQRTDFFPAADDLAAHRAHRAVATADHHQVDLVLDGAWADTTAVTTGIPAVLRRIPAMSPGAEARRGSPSGRA